MFFHYVALMNLLERNKKRKIIHTTNDQSTAGVEKSIQSANNELVVITSKTQHSELCKYRSNPSYLFQPSGEGDVV